LQKLLDFSLEKYNAIPNFTQIGVKKVYEFGMIIKEVIHC